MKHSDLTIYQLGALTHYELAKKAKKTAAIEGFLDPKVFAMSFGWFQTKKKRGYSLGDASRFMAGFGAAAKLKAQDDAKRRGARG